MDGLISRLLASALLAALALAGWQWSEATRARAAVSDVRAEFAQYRETQERQAKEDLETLRAEKNHGDKLRQEAIDAEYLSRLAAQADADRLRGTAGQLQRFAADLATSLAHAQRDPAAASGSAPTATAADLCPVLLGRIDEAAERIARYADQARVAGQLCADVYTALK